MTKKEKINMMRENPQRFIESLSESRRDKPCKFYLDATYIKMCIKSKELQLYYDHPEIGDFIFDRSNENLLIVNRNAFAYHLLETNRRISVPDIGKIKNPINLTKPNRYGKTNDNIGDKSIKERQFIWLPRQDQLQEMIIKGANKEAKDWEERSYISLLAGFPLHILDILYKEAIKNNQLLYWYNIHKNAPFEILYLSFYMKLFHNKFWRGKEWGFNDGK